jgi:RimJ/RimL family protein N-acetyltransferase
MLWEEEPMDAPTPDPRRYVEDTRANWDRIAAWWDGTVGESANAAVRPAVHPCFNTNGVKKMVEEEIVDGQVVSLRPPDPGALRAAGAGSDVAASVTRWLAEAEARDDVYYFAVCHADELVGQIFLHDIEPNAGEALVGYHLFRPGDRGRGIGARALALLLAFVRDHTALRRLIVITSADNVASRRVAEKNGFRYAGAPREDPDGILLRRDVPRPGRAG